MAAPALATMAKARLFQRVLAALVVMIPVGMAALLGGTTVLVTQIAGASTPCRPLVHAPLDNGTAAEQGQPRDPTADSITVQGPGNVPMTLDLRQQNIAETYISVGSKLGVSVQGIQIAIMMALQESGLRMLANPAVPESLSMPHDDLGFDHDSIGSAQQRSSAGWGTVRELMDPTYNAEAFFGGPTGPNFGSPRGLLDIPGWSTMGLGAAAQAVQVSAFPELYERWAPSAESIMGHVTGGIAARSCQPDGPSNDTPPPMSPGTLSSIRADVLRYAVEGVGGSYVWGGTAFKAWDCSGYVQWIYAQAGIQLPRTEQWLAGHPTTAPQPGDLVVQNPDGPNHWAHIGIYAGHGMMYSALNPSVGTLLHPIDWNPGTQYFTVLPDN